MSNVPISIEGIPLTELIGKEVVVKFISGRTPITRLMHRQRGSEILWHFEPASSTGNYKLIILIINLTKKTELRDSREACYSCLYSNVELSQVKDGTEFDVNTSKMQERLNSLILNKI